MATSRCSRAAGCVADVTGQAVGGDDAEPGTGDDRDSGCLGALVQVVEGAEHLQLVANVEVVHSCAQACFGERDGGVQERAGGIQDQVHAGQRSGQCGWVVQGQDPVGQVEALGQCGDGWRAAACEQGPVTALVCVLGDLGAGVAGGAVEHPGARPAVAGDVLAHGQLLLFRLGVMPALAGALAQALDSGVV